MELPHKRSSSATDDAIRTDRLAGLQRLAHDGSEISGDRGVVRLRTFAGAVRGAAYTLAVVLSLFELYVLYVYAIDPWIHRAAYLSLALALIFALVPASARAPRDKVPWYDWFLIASTVAISAYILITFDTLIYRVGSSPTDLDTIVGSLAVLLVLESMRRTSGYALPAICVVFVAYALFGSVIPGLLTHRGYSLSRTVSLLYSTEGLYGVPLGVSATYVFVFILFGAFLQRSATGEFFVRLALSLTAWTRGGAAKVPVLASALFGTISGSVVANVVVDGPLTIPLMVRAGLQKSTAAAIEAVASTGGQIMPPVMGAAAFLMAEIIGRPYSEIMLAGFIPALLYYAALYFMIDFYALKHGLHGVSRDRLPRLGMLLRHEGYLLLPLVVLLYVLLALDQSPLQAALYAIGVTIVASWFRRSTRLLPKDIPDTLAAAARGVMEVAATTAGAGIIIGILALTGMGVKASSTILSYSGGELLPALVLSMIICLILGMGMPTIAAYATAATVVPAALAELGVPELRAHMFVFYFACLSAITPPVALGAYAAAAIAQASMWKVGLEAVKIGVAGFIVPFTFIYGPALLLEGSALEVALALLSGLIGVAALAAAVQGYFLRRCLWFERLALFGGALLLIRPGLLTDGVGMLLIAVVGAAQHFNLPPRLEPARSPVPERSDPRAGESPRS